MSKTAAYTIIISLFLNLILGILLLNQKQQLKEWRNQAITAEEYIQELQGE